jgi:hypothetical protein
MTMETITEITQAEAERRDRARRYEAALNLRISSQEMITRMQSRAEGYAKQVTVLDALLAQAATLDGTMDVTVSQLGGSISGPVRTNVLALLTKARADQQRRLDDANSNLAKARRDLQDAEQVIADLS